MVQQYLIFTTVFMQLVDHRNCYVIVDMSYHKINWISFLNFGIRLSAKFIHSCRLFTILSEASLRLRENDSLSQH